MVGPYGDWLRFPYEQTENLHIIPEIDCCRIVTDHSTELLQRVPPTTSLLLRIGSIEPGALLLDACDAFEAGSASSDEAARAITKTGLLTEAIESCTEAATREFDVVMQKRLLRSASYGMHFSYKDPVERWMPMGGATTDVLTKKKKAHQQHLSEEEGEYPEEEDEDEEEDSPTRPSKTAMKFVAAAQKLRIINALRSPSVGFALTSSQYDAIGPNGVVARLVMMKRPALASSIAEYLGLEDNVRSFARSSKAAAFVSSVAATAAASGGRTDAEIAEIAIRILRDENFSMSTILEDKTSGSTTTTPSSTTNTTTLSSPATSNSVLRGSYAAVALAAHRAGKAGVANLLLLLETSVIDKVPALISIGSHADAASVAAMARDTDLIFLSLMEFEKYCMSNAADPNKGQHNFLNTIVTKFPPEATNLLKTYYSSMSDVKFVMNLLLRSQNFVDAGTTMAKRALDSSKEQERLTMLKEASRVFGLGKESAFQKSCTDDYMELLSEQGKLRSIYGPEVVPESSSVTSTIFSIIQYAGVKPREAHKLFAEAEKMAKRFRVPEKRLWHVKVRAFAESGQWANLRNLADSRAKSPIGFKPFALAVIKGKQSTSEIMRYVDRVASLEERYDLFCEAKLWKRALEEAAKLKDYRRMMHVQSLSNSLEIQQLCNKMAARLG